MARAPTRLARYEIRGELGRGGMGVVYEAWDPELERAVAIKVLADARRPSAEALEQLTEEGRVTARLEHPGIVPLYDMGHQPDVGLFLVMRRVEGRSLAQLLHDLRSGEPATAAAWSLRRLLSAFVQICHAVAFAHDAGYLHRDIKPHNVMLGRFGEVLLLDWGVASLPLGPGRRVDVDSPTFGGSAPTLDGTSVGTPGYMSPEQARGQRGLVDVRSDVFALGATLYELLTLHGAFDGIDTAARTFQLMQGPPLPPRVRAPDRQIPEEIANVAMRALHPERERRTPTVAALAAAVEAFLEGSRRREAARGHLKEAERAWQGWLDLAEEGDVLAEAEAELAEAAEPWTPLEDKAQLLHVRERQTELAADRARAWSALIGACEQALAHDPDCDARSLLAEAHLQRFLDAEADGDREQAVLHRERTQALDPDGRHAAVLRGAGSLTLTTDPPGAEVLCRTFDRAPLVWTLGEPTSLGRTPLRDLPMEMGSYLLSLEHPGREPVRYPVAIDRGARWHGGPSPVRLPGRGELPQGLVYVPAGPFRSGGDPLAQDALPASRPFEPGFLIAALPVTMQQYADFLSDLHRTDADQAWARVPRREAGVKGGDRGQYWARPEPGAPYLVPERDTDGDRWDPRWPAIAISWDDAHAYVRWRSDRDGLPWALPTESQWEKATRGVDGRAFPWGDRFDYSLCLARHSRPGPPSPAPVGERATDASVYGVRDLAGGVREWCADPSVGPDDPRRPVRGGSWFTAESWCRAATRLGFASDAVAANQGFRLVRPLP